MSGAWTICRYFNISIYRMSIWRRSIHRYANTNHAYGHRGSSNKATNSFRIRILHPTSSTVACFTSAMHLQPEGWQAMIWIMWFKTQNKIYDILGDIQHFFIGTVFDCLICSWQFAALDSGIKLLKADDSSTLPAVYLSAIKPPALIQHFCTYILQPSACLGWSLCWRPGVKRLVNYPAQARLA